MQMYTHNFNAFKKVIAHIVLKLCTSFWLAVFLTLGLIMQSGLDQHRLHQSSIRLSTGYDDYRRCYAIVIIIFYVARP